MTSRTKHKLLFKNRGFGIIPILVKPLGDWRSQFYITKIDDHFYKPLNHFLTKSYLASGIAP